MKRNIVWHGKAAAGERFGGGMGRRGACAKAAAWRAADGSVLLHLPSAGSNFAAALAPLVDSPVSYIPCRSC